jgi:hypothetical protein
MVIYRTIAIVMSDGNLATRIGVKDAFPRLTIMISRKGKREGLADGRLGIEELASIPELPSKFRIHAENICHEASSTINTQVFYGGRCFMATWHLFLLFTSEE